MISASPSNTLLLSSLVTPLRLDFMLCAVVADREDGRYTSGC